MLSYAQQLRRLASSYDRASEASYWASLIRNKFGITVKRDSGVHSAHTIARELYFILNQMPPKLVRGCGVYTLTLKSDMGPNKPYYPNHGFYIHNSVTLNADIFYHPDWPEDFMDHRGYFLTRAQQTLLHEFGHGFDKNNGQDGKELSLQPEWLQLSGWSETPKSGLKKLIIREPGVPEVKGEWFFDPSCQFTRFYAKRNPWDDWADAFSFYVAKMFNIIPPDKKAYFDNLLKDFLV